MAHIAVIVADFYKDIAQSLQGAAMKHCEANGHTSELLTVPGALELPHALQLAAQSRKFDGAVVLGCVIRGESTHYDYVCEHAIRGVLDVSMAYGLPTGNGILTVENAAQALARADGTKCEKGVDAAAACLRLLALQEQMIPLDDEEIVAQLHQEILNENSNKGSAA